MAIGGDQIMHKSASFQSKLLVLVHSKFSDKYTYKQKLQHILSHFIQLRNIFGTEFENLWYFRAK